MTDIVTAVYELMGKFADPTLDHEGVREKVDRMFQVRNTWEPKAKGRGRAGIREGGREEKKTKEDKKERKKNSLKISMNDRRHSSLIKLSNLQVES